MPFPYCPTALFPYSSTPRTIWASLITILTAAAGILGVPVAGIDNSALTDTLLQAITAVSGLVTIFGRLGASSRIR